MWLHSLIRLYRKEKQESAHRYARAIQKKILISLSNVLKRLEKRLENKLLQDKRIFFECDHGNYVKPEKIERKACGKGRNTIK